MRICREKKGIFMSSLGSFCSLFDSNSTAPAKKPQLVVDLTAEAAPVVEGSTFFSPSCHDWEQQCLLTNAAWTPFSSPWRNDSGLGNWPKLVRKADAIIDNIG